MTHTHTEISRLTADQKRALLQRLLREKRSADHKHPLSFAQQRLWFFDKLEPNSALYNIPTVLRLRGPIHLENLRRGLENVLERHEALRATFEETDGAPAQRIQPPQPIDFRVADLSHLASDPRNSEWEAAVSEEIRRPFDLTKDPLVRARLFRLAPQEHVLVLVIHHIVADEWSMRILFREWAEYYRALMAGAEPALGELPMQYRDFARWQNGWIKSVEYSRQLAYWSERLRSPTTLQLPTDFQRSTGQTFAGAVASAMLPRELLERLKDFSRREGGTLFMTLLAALKVLLFRYTQQRDIIVGCPIAGRSLAETEPLIGFFVNTLALRTAIQPDQTFREFFRQVREETLGAFAHQEMPFDKLVEELHPHRDSTHTPFVQVFFALNNEFIEKSIFPEVESEEIEVETGTAKFDLTVVARDSREGLRLLAEYNRDLFAPERIARMLEHLRELLEGILANPDERVARLNLLTPGERISLLSASNTPDYPRNDSVHQIFEWQVSKSPEAIALDYDGRTITYRELNARANQLAHYLRQNKAGPGTLVGVYMERSIEMIVAFLGILKAGAAYVPLDFSYPLERLAFMIEDTQMPVILTQREHLSELPASGAQAFCLDTEWNLIGQLPRIPPANAARADALAYVIYTSGSSGKPKGVAVPHRGITRLVLNTDYVKITPGDHVAQASNASFDAATFEIWGALLNGARLEGMSREITLSPEDFARALRVKRITTLFVTTALFNQLAREVPGVFSSLGTALFGGEAVDPKWVRAVLAGGPPKRLLHVYGPTENTTFSTWHLVENLEDDAHTVPVGRPIANSELYILDPALNPVPIGIPGEIYVGGDGLARGYWNSPDPAELKFIPHPFSADRNARLYRTGDLARFNANLEVEFIGRLDQQIKLRGFRIEPGEIESLLHKHPAISEAVAVAREDVPGDQRLVAYLVPRGASPETDALKAFLRENLPDYMIPSAFVFMESFPLTPNEKIDRHALPSPEHNRPLLNKTFIAPRDSVEQQLAKIFEKILGVQPIGVADNFFELGGHSLLAVRVFSQIEKIFGKKLPLATLFRAPTIEEIARVLREENPAKSWSTLVDIQPKGSRPPFFWLHTLGGDGGGGFFYYRKLAELLGPDQPSFGIRSPREPFTRIEEMAKFYIEEIRKFQPRGPYFLGGFCFGGNVAYEMARQLRIEGEEIGLLVMLESAPPNVDQKHSWSATAAKYSLENFVENLKDFVGNEGRMALLRNKGKRLTKRIKRSLAGEDEEKPVVLGEVLDLTAYPEGYVHYAETHWAALTKYHPPAYGGNLVLFRAKKQGLSNFAHTLGWDALVEDRVHVTVIPGTHESMLQEPNVQIVAAKLRQFLNDAQRNAARPESELAPVN
jgi:amino acid adenylation domain-containing protein